MTAPQITVVGASGWLGRTLVHEYASVYGPDSLHRLRLYGSRDSILRLSGPHEGVCLPVSPLLSLGASDIAQSSALFWYAFVLRNRFAELGAAKYRKTNDDIASRVMSVIDSRADMPVVFASSGVALERGGIPTYDDDPYAHLKLVYEQRLQGRRNLSVLYPYAVTGMYMGEPHKFALGSFIQQQRRSGSIAIEANGPVIRSFGSAHDLSRLLLASLVRGGPLPRRVVPISFTLDLVQLGVEVAAALGSEPNVQVGELNGSPDKYCSDDPTFGVQLAALGIRPTPVAEQIRVTSRGPMFE